MCTSDFEDMESAFGFLDHAILGDFDGPQALVEFVEHHAGRISPQLTRYLRELAAAEEAEMARDDPLELFQTEESIQRLNESMERVHALRRERAAAPSPPELPLVFGTIWMPKDPPPIGYVPAPHSFLVLATPEDQEDPLVQVAPIFFWPALAPADAFVLPHTAHHLGCFAMMSCEHPVPRELLSAGIGILDELELRALMHWRMAQYGAEHDATILTEFRSCAQQSEVLGLYHEYAALCDAPFRAAAIELMTRERAGEERVTSLMNFKDFLQHSSQAEAALPFLKSEGQMMAAQSLSKLHARPTIFLFIEEPCAEFELCPSDEEGSWELELVAGDAAVFEGATLQDSLGSELARMREGHCRFIPDCALGFQIVLCKGSKVVLHLKE